MNKRPSRFSFVILLKWAALIPLLLFYIAVSTLLTVFPMTAKARRFLCTLATSFCSGLALRIFGVRIICRQPERLKNHGRIPGRLVVANHLSYVDVLIIASRMPSVFVTSRELKHTPLLGMLAQFGGSLFVERRSPFGLKREIASVAQTLSQGFQVVLFPEGTTSNGDGVRQFKQSLFDAAVSAGAEILPLCLRYRRINRSKISVGTREDLFYYGGVRFSDHFPRFLSLRSVEAELLPLQTIAVDHGASRKEIAAAARDSIAKAFHEPREVL